MPETLRSVIKRLINEGMTRFDSKKIYHESINALDVDFYSFEEIRDLFKEILKDKGNN